MKVYWVEVVCSLVRDYLPQPSKRVDEDQIWFEVHVSGAMILGY